MTGSPLLHFLPLRAFRAGGDISAPSLDREGFVHCSPDVATTLAVANKFYREAAEPMIALELDPARLLSPVRWEPAAPEPPEGVAADVLFPHVYGPLQRSAVIGVRYARREVRGRYLALERRGATAEEFDLLPHPEGGWFRRTWTSRVEMPEREGAHPAVAALFFLLQPGECSRWHTAESDEVWLWHRGGPMELSVGGRGARPAAEPEVIALGAEAGRSPQLVVPAGTWRRAAATVTAEALVSRVVSPGSSPAGFRTV